tara:strand:- start:173 stop:388 length:216 start_codon:yes stop_codon:yes gene_type:complete
MAITKRRNTGRPNNFDASLKRAVELTPPDLFAHNTADKAEHIKNILGIEGDAVGTLNTQELFNKTTDGGYF